jgi:hypothetical protein
MPTTWIGVSERAVTDGRIIPEQLPDCALPD